MSPKVQALEYGDRKVYTVAALNRGISLWLRRLPELWVEGEVTELKRNARWASVFFTLKDPATGACVPASIDRRRFDRLELELADGEKVHVLGRGELYEAKGELSFRAVTIERFGLGAHLAAIERLRRALAAEGLFAEARKRPLPRFPRAVGLLTGTDAAARGDILTAIGTRFPPARVVVAETRVQGRGAAEAIVRSLEALAAHPAVDVVVLARGGGSFEDLLPFSAEAVVRAVAASPVPVVSAVGHEQDTPLCDLAADVRASTPTAAARLVVPDLDELVAGLERSRAALGLGVRRLLERDRDRVARLGERLRTAPALLLERRRTSVEVAGARLRAISPHATVARGYAIVRAGGAVLREVAAVVPGDPIDVELAAGSLGARVEEVRP
ncbi:MAG TPA: exodeoxyribonuclease VII large subunit [Gaiellaceae bacterium]